jgi:hypothetical protein
MFLHRLLVENYTFMRFHVPARKSPTVIRPPIIVVLAIAIQAPWVFM